jgi:hypothetical protein
LKGGSYTSTARSTIKPTYNEQLKLSMCLLKRARDKGILDSRLKNSTLSTLNLITVTQPEETLIGEGIVNLKMARNYRSVRIPQVKVGIYAFYIFRMKPNVRKSQSILPS